MSSGCKHAVFSMTLLVILTITPADAHAQDAGGDAAAMAQQQSGEVRDALAEPDCEQDEFQRDTIVVCAEMGEEEATRAVMSVLPEPLVVQVNELEGLREPPCWVTGRWPCGRFGFAPPPVVLIDLDQFPDALTAEEAAQVYAVEDEK